MTQTTKTSKGEATRQRLLDAALALFREKGFDATTMRDIAKAAGMSVGATYHYFASKEAIVHSYYGAVIDGDEARLRETLAEPLSLRERLGHILHSKVRAIAPDKDMMAGLFRRVADRRDPVSIFSENTGDDRRRSIALFARATADQALPTEAAEVVPLALWALQLGIILYHLADESEGDHLTHTLVDGALDMAVPLIELARNQAFMAPMVASLRDLLARTDLLPTALPSLTGGLPGSPELDSP